jgi:hypothetical protein
VEAEQVTAHRGVDDLVNLRQPEGVLGAVFVEISVVNANPPLSCVLLAESASWPLIILVIMTSTICGI